MTNLANRPKVLLLCIARAGYRQGSQLADFIYRWENVVREHGDGTIEHFIANGRMQRRTAYRRLALFRATFPQLGPQGTPSGLMGPLLERLATEAELEGFTT